LETVSAAARAIANLNGKSGWLVKFANNDMGAGKGNSGGMGGGAFGGLPSGPKVRHTNIFVGGLPEGMDDARLREAFSPYGVVNSASVRTKGGQTYGFVEFTLVEEAERAVAAMESGACPPGWVVKFANWDTGITDWNEAVPHSNVYVGGLPNGFADLQLKQACSSYGTVESAFVKSDSETGRTYGFVKFTTNAAARRAIADLHGKNDWVVKVANNDSYPAGGKGFGKGWADGWVWQPPTSKLERDECQRNEGPPSDNLYVKDLPPGISEQEVTNTFARYGQVMECRVLRWDCASSCAALVRMASMEQATLAKANLDNTIHESCGKPLTVAPQQKNGMEVDDHCYIKGLHCTTMPEQLEAVFSRYGIVKWSKILPTPFRPNSSNVPDYAALVQMESADQARAAIAALNGTIPTELGTPMIVRFAEAKTAGQRADATPNNNLYVKGWPMGFPDFLLQHEFQAFGNVVRLRLLDNPDPDQPTCAALVQMSRVEEATMAMKALHGKTISVNRLPPMRVKYAGREQAPGENLYVTALPRTITEDQVRQTFAKYGEIKRLKLLTQHARPETHVLIQLASPQIAAQALRELDGSAPAFRGPTLSVQYAMKREPQR